MRSRSVVERFNARINAGDLTGLSSMMTHDHVFIDAKGSRIAGRTAAAAAWSAFFASFPDYRNEFERIVSRGREVVVAGRSRCSDARLDGPALWRATLRGDRIREWRVYEDTARNRSALGLQGR